MLTAKVATILATSSYRRETPTTVLHLNEKLLQRGARSGPSRRAFTLTNKDHSEPGSIQEFTGKEHTYVGRYIDILLRAGLHYGSLKWVSRILGVQELGVENHQMLGTIIGSLGDAWRFIRAADRVLCVPTYR